MSYKAQKIIIRIVLIGVIAVVACGVLFGIILKPKGYTGEEWYAKQDEYLGQLETFASTLDDVMTLYITGSVSEEDLMNYTGMLRNELDVMVYEYDTDIAENPLQTGTVSEKDQVAANSVRQCYDVFYDILNEVEANSSDPARLRYIYLGYHQIFNEAASGYFTAKLLDYYDSLQETDEDYTQTKEESAAESAASTS